MSDLSKRLAIFVPGMGAGGAERSMLKLAGGIAARGHTVDLVLSRAHGPYLTEVPSSIRLVDLRAPRMVASLPALLRYVRRERPAALLSILHGNLIALWARRLASVPTRVVISERNTLSREVAGYTTDMRMRLMPRLAGRFYPWADAIVAVSHGVADDLATTTGIPRERIIAIYNPIVTPDLQTKASASIEHPWLRAGEPPVVLAVARLSAQKDLVTLIRAFAQVRQRGSARLLILGEGEERPALEALVAELGLEDKVGLPGFVPNPYPYMVRAAAFVLSSRWEGLPGVLIEALYCGTRIIATDCPSGPSEILAGGAYGQLIPVGDVSAMARAIEIALDGQGPLPSRESWYPFALDTVVDQYLEVLLPGAAGLRVSDPSSTAVPCRVQIGGCHEG